MSGCWYCYWGWPKQVYDIGKKHEDRLADSELAYGPGHVVWSDENFDTAIIEACIRDAEEYRGDLSDAEFSIHVESLRELLTVPEEIRCCEPEAYDGEGDTSLVPPPVGIEMVKADL